MTAVLAAALAAGLSTGAGALPLDLESARQGLAQDWDLRDEHNRPLRDPVLLRDMMQAELDAVYGAAFRQELPTTRALLALAAAPGRPEGWRRAAPPDSAPEPAAPGRVEARHGRALPQAVSLSLAADVPRDGPQWPDGAFQRLPSVRLC